MLPRFPAWYASCVQQVLGHAPDDAAALRRHAPALHELSTYLTDLRPRADGSRAYLRSTAARDAYFLYYTTANALKPLVVLDELARSSAFRSDRSRSVLELGAGTGTGLLALALWKEHATSRIFPGDDGAHRAPAFELTATDRLDDTLEFIRRVHHALRIHAPEVTPGVRTRRLDLARPPAPEPFDIVLAMNVLNELPPGDVERRLEWLAASLAPGGSIILLEPALRETSRTLLALRDAAVRTGWTVYAPCFRQADCPALARERDWCHHDLEWNRPEWIAAIDRMLGNVKLSLKFSYLVLNRHGETLADAFHEHNTYHRVVSEIFLEKGRTHFFLCGDDGRHRYQRNRRDTTYENAVVDDLHRYDIVSIRGAHPRPGDMLIDQGTVVIKV